MTPAVLALLIFGAFLGYHLRPLVDETRRRLRDSRAELRDHLEVLEQRRARRRADQQRIRDLEDELRRLKRGG